MSGAHVAVVSTGAARPVPWRGRPVTSAIAKSPVSGSVEVGPLGLAGDEQGDRENHGGPDKAVLLYPGEHYAAWAEEVGELAMPAFGENLTTSGLLESDVVLGSVYSAGSVLLQVSQPRRPCYKLAAHHGIADMAVRTQRSGRTGFYCRVLRAGSLAAGDALELTTRPSHGITAAEVHRVLNVDRDDEVAVRRLLRHAYVLPESWVKLLRRRIDGDLEGQGARLEG
ncbi:MOSC domain-containing protein [Lentzea flaviverrucosa]|uniref:MOSC domain-containing protein YiiM n=1 Tax=Lentzea flaviverrucosa TaxID=200379 RepID=A0A1H9JAF8_9PSEU|nr:MOSC domain-containing protein [Lentzea flaviverrucosa]RDI26444.1 MOSC domain-containing protein YiiM [Lentzea flaviverrucosa]SEQ83864.1 MOSC domain-containing protein YiiM [Lentzea flaviverrucosa]